MNKGSKFFHRNPVKKKCFKEHDPQSKWNFTSSLKNLKKNLKKKIVFLSLTIKKKLKLKFKKKKN